jgi:hypothetical protein
MKYKVIKINKNVFFSECELADFSSGNSSEKIPFVFLPLDGQLIYPR